MYARQEHSSSSNSSNSSSRERASGGELSGAPSTSQLSDKSLRGESEREGKTEL